MSQFGDLVDAFLEEFFRLFPVAATATGMHDVDGEWPDLECGRPGPLGWTSPTAGTPSSAPLPTRL